MTTVSGRHNSRAPAGRAAGVNPLIPDEAGLGFTRYTILVKHLYRSVNGGRHDAPRGLMRAPQCGSVGRGITLSGGSCDERRSRELQGKKSETSRIVTFQSGVEQNALDTMGVSA